MNTGRGGGGNSNYYEGGLSGTAGAENYPRGGFDDSQRNFQGNNIFQGNGGNRHFDGGRGGFHAGSGFNRGNYYRANNSRPYARGGQNFCNSDRQNGSGFNHGNNSGRGRNFGNHAVDLTALQEQIVLNAAEAIAK
jgi:hypothetical protein